MKSIVISQPMLFPWVGLFEQILLADVFVYYDDVSFSKGSFSNRVQLKNTAGIEWMTIPLRQFHLGQLINQTRASDKTDWRKHHLEQFHRCYAQATYFDDALQLLSQCYATDSDSVCEITMASMKGIIDYLALNDSVTCLRSSDLNQPGNSSQRVLDIVLAQNCDTYITGHGARHYLDHELFEGQGVSVEYMDYQLTPYTQLHGDFNPYVSILDLIANTGPDSRQFLKPETVHWRKFIND